MDRQEGLILELRMKVKTCIVISRRILVPSCSKAPYQVTPGIRKLEGRYINDLGVSQPWRAHYDEYGRLKGRTDFNAGNPVAGIPDIHHHTYE
jgi:hypothetical protein